MKIRHGKIFMLSFFTMLLCSASLSFSKSSSKNSRQNQQSSYKASEDDIRVGAEIFFGNDRESIRRYFHNHAGTLPPGLAKRDGDLPPGLQKQLQRNGQLPPGLAKKVSAFPVELERGLPPLKPGLMRGVIEGRAVIYNAKTSIILDIFSIF